MRNSFDFISPLLAAFCLLPAIVAQSADVFHTIHTFDGEDGANPLGGLTLGRDDKLYGATQNGGTGDAYGTVFRIDSAGTVTIVYSFRGGSDGSFPAGGVALGQDGNFFRLRKP
jgi:uncharacterized repeat protein (TIGR03803 family)